MNLDTRQIIAIALYNKGIALKRLNRSTEEVACYNELVQRFSNTQELVLKEIVAQALVNKVFALANLNQDSTELVLQESVAKALVNKGITLGSLIYRVKPLLAMTRY